MILGVLSDVHCNADVLRRALDAMAGTVDEVVIAGDLVLEYRFSNDVVALAREAGARCVLGNHDLGLLAPSGERARASANPELLAWLAAQPLRQEWEVDGTRLLLVHGTPWAPYTEYVHPNTPGFARYADVDADIVITGHTHLPYADQVGSTLVVNPGSIAEPRGQGVDRVGTWAAVDTATRQVRIERLTPDDRAVA